MMADYVKTIKTMENAIPKIDYKGLEEALTVFSNSYSRLHVNVLGSMEPALRELQVQLRERPILDPIMLKSLQKQLGSLSKVEDSISVAFSKIDTESITKALKVSNPFANYDYSVMAKALQNSFIKAEAKQSEVNLESIVEDVQEEYNTTDIIEENTLKNVQNRKAKEKVSTDDVWKIFERFALIITIIVGLRELFGGIATNNYNTVNETNNYYINELKVDADYWNMFQYRIVNQNNIMPRVKPNCKSQVTGHLSKGRVVQMCDKHRKWVKIYWIDEDGNEHYGWIQNYKLEKFVNN